MDDLNIYSNPKNESLTLCIYVLYLASFILGGFTALIALIINYVKLEDVKNTYLESHFRYQIRTFWFGLLWGAIGVITLIFLVGYIILLLNFIWTIYRYIKGYAKLSKKEPI